MANVAAADDFADAAGRDGKAANAARGVYGNAEAEFMAKGLQAVDACLGVVAEAEVFALVYFGGVDGVDENVSCEVAGVHVTELIGEGEDEAGVDAGGGKEFEFAMERG